MNLPDWSREIHFAFSRRCDGQMSFKQAEPDLVVANRKRFFSSLNLDLSSVVAGEIAHGSEIALVSEVNKGRGATTRNWIRGVDGFVTKSRGILLLTTHADCIPLVIYNRRVKILGQAHAGWRGLAKGIVENLIEVVRSVGGDNSDDMNVWIGPKIGVCCYSVGNDVAAMFPENCCVIKEDTIHLDLALFVQNELERLGVMRKNITDSGICTSCDSNFSSYRRDGIGVTAMACVTGLKST